MKATPDAAVIGSSPWCVAATNRDGRTERSPCRPRTPRLPCTVRRWRRRRAANGRCSVQAHGTGAIGDGIEYLARVANGASPCAFGSYKSNMGLAARYRRGPSGRLAGLSLRHGVTPHFAAFARWFELSTSETGSLCRKRFAVLTVMITPEAGRGVLVQGSGPALHAIIEEAPANFPKFTGRRGVNRIVMLSSHVSDALPRGRHLGGRTQDCVAASGSTTARGRAHRPVRTAVVTASLPEPSRSLRRWPTVTPSDQRWGLTVIEDRWVFSGQGAVGGDGRTCFRQRTAIRGHHHQLEPVTTAESGSALTEATARHG